MQKMRSIQEEEKKFERQTYTSPSSKICCRNHGIDAKNVGRINGVVGESKFGILTLIYITQFWSYEHVVNIFLVPFDLKKHFKIISEHVRS